jgi:hypothetical protein
MYISVARNIVCHEERFWQSSLKIQLRVLWGLNYNLMRRLKPAKSPRNLNFPAFCI